MAGIAALLLLSWAYLLFMAWGMENMDRSAHWILMPAMVGWDGVDLALVFLMWAVMMAAMMLPSAMPALALFSRIAAARAQPASAFTPTAFALGYLAAWTGFSVIATLAQWALLEARLVSPMMSSTSPVLSASLLAAAGVYQLTPLKHACLSRCRSPLALLMNEWREGHRGAFVMGARQGAYCTGCCWLLMALLFVFGVMNIVWIAALTMFVLVEKLLRLPRWFGPATGAVLLAWGAAIAYSAVYA